MFSFYKVSKLVALTIVLSFASACGTQADTCSSNTDCASNQYCASSGGVFFESGHCLDRSSQQGEDSTVSDTQDVASSESEQDTGVANTDNDSMNPTDLDSDQLSEPVAEHPDFGTLIDGNVTCTEDTACVPAEYDGPAQISACTFESTCANSGSQIVEHQVFSCFENHCYQKSEQETTICNRNTNGTSCDEQTPQPVWDACIYASCADSAIVSGQIAFKYCEAGACTRTETLNVGPDSTRCNRNPRGKSCTTVNQKNGVCKGVGQSTCMEKVVVDPGDPVEL